MRPGTWPDRCISNPLSPMCQVIRSWLRGMTVAWKRPRAMPVGSAVTRAAEAPSANSRKLSIFGTSWKSSCRCRLESSRLTTSTRERGVGADDLVGQFQGVDRGEAAHEADDGALGAVRQAGRAHDLEIEARGGEAGATGDDQVGDAVRLQRCGPPASQGPAHAAHTAPCGRRWRGRRRGGRSRRRRGPCRAAWGRARRWRSGARCRPASPCGRTGRACASRSGCRGRTRRRRRGCRAVGPRCRCG